MAAFGEFGRVHRDFTAIGSTVNLAARLQAAAGSGEILASAAVVERIAVVKGQAGERRLTPKGYAEPVTAYLV